MISGAGEEARSLREAGERPGRPDRAAARARQQTGGAESLREPVHHETSRRGDGAPQPHQRAEQRAAESAARCPALRQIRQRRLRGRRLDRRQTEAARCRDFTRRSHYARGKGRPFHSFRRRRVLEKLIKI